MSNGKRKQGKKLGQNGTKGQAGRIKLASIHLSSLDNTGKKIGGSQEYQTTLIECDGFVAITIVSCSRKHQMFLRAESKWLFDTWGGIEASMTKGLHKQAFVKTCCTF